MNHKPVFSTFSFRNTIEQHTSTCLLQIKASLFVNSIKQQQVIQVGKVLFCRLLPFYFVMCICSLTQAILSQRTSKVSSTDLRICIFCIPSTLYFKRFIKHWLPRVTGVHCFPCCNGLFWCPVYLNSLCAFTWLHSIVFLRGKRRSNFKEGRGHACDLSMRCRGDDSLQSLTRPAAWRDVPTNRFAIQSQKTECFIYAVADLFFFTRPSDAYGVPPIDCIKYHVSSG